jgi:integrase
MGKKESRFTMKRPRGTGSIFKQKNSEVWWIKYYRNGKAIRESTGTTKRRTAEDILDERRADVCKGTFIEPADRKLTVDELYAALLDDYRNNERASLEGAEQRWQRQGRDGEPTPEPGRLKKHFSGIRALAVTTDMLNRYISWCREQELSNGTINRDLAALRRAFNLALRAGKLQKVPNFPHLKEAPPRSGFVEEAQYQKLAKAARELWLRALLATAYTFGLRKDELLNLRVRQLDLLDRTIRLNAGETKSGEGRVIKLTTGLFILLSACVAGKEPDNFVFTRRDGKKPVLDFRQRWENLTAAAGCPGLLFHDLRRSAVRNMTRRGVIEGVAMKISGHKTRSVFERYNIVSESDLADAALKIEAGQKPAEPVWAEFGHSQADNRTAAAPAQLPS